MYATWFSSVQIEVKHKHILLYVVSVVQLEAGHTTEIYVLKPFSVQLHRTQAVINDLKLNLMNRWGTDGDSNVNELSQGITQLIGQQ